MRGRHSNAACAGMRGVARAYLLLISLGGLIAAGCDSAPPPKTYSADPITATVVDAETGKPVEGANVIAMWEMKYGLENHGTNYAMVMEAVTDAEGRFSFAGWGPRVVTVPGRITTQTPRFIIFKSNYQLAMGANSSATGTAPSHMSSVWNGKSFKLVPFSESKEKYAEYLYLYLQGNIDELMKNGCHGINIPQFLRAYDLEAKSLAKGAVASRVPTVHELSRKYQQSCGDLAAVVMRIPS